jgi:hypothetical protein
MMQGKSLALVQGTALVRIAKSTAATQDWHSIMHPTAMHNYNSTRHDH